jgi:hypothetical protein
MTLVLPNGHSAGLSITGKEFHFWKKLSAPSWIIFHMWILLLAVNALALDGQPQIHDPSTIIQ